MKSNPFIFTLIITSLSMTTGCFSLQEELSESMHQANIVHRAEAAWHCAHACYRGIENRHDFHGGFRDGYIAVANGGDGCVPAIAPQKYWSSCFSDDNGHCSTQAWFQGYAHGAIAAEQDGAATLNQLMLSSTYLDQSSGIQEECEHYFEGDQNIENLGIEPLIVPELPDSDMDYATPLE